LFDFFICNCLAFAASGLAFIDFKVHFLINSFVERLGFVVFSRGEFYFEDSSVDNWEDPDQFEAKPYFVKLAKYAGMKKVKNEYMDSNTMLAVARYIVESRRSRNSNRTSQHTSQHS
jgi:hypothetical protein